ncbi:hypothetical protein YSY43_14970 [Paenibacillus sp. YSY-4.3]
MEQPSGYKVMAADVQVELAPGGWRIGIPAAGKGTEQPACSVLLLEADAPGAGRRLLQSLAQQPLELAALQEAGASAIAGLLPKTPPWQPAEGPPRSRCSSCGAEAPCGHAAQAASAGAAAWRAASPEQRLTLLGWTRETLLAAVLAAWAEAQPLPDAAEALRAALGPRKEEARARSGGPSIAEWLAEMAEQGSLHAPGPQFHDVQISLDAAEPSPPPPDADAEALAKLLPGVRGAAKGLGLVREGVMQRAGELASQLRHEPR